MADKKKNKNIKNKNFLDIAKIKNIYRPKTKKTNKNSYEIIKKIGEGSYGVVYLIKHKKKSKLYVLKKIDLKDLSEGEIKETYNEVNLLKKLDHPNIIKFIEVIKSPRYLEIITEYAEKGDLYSQICLQKQHKKRLPEKIIIDWLVQTCQALKYIHSKHIIHRDIKPQNIFLSDNGSIKLGDFGVSKTLNNTLEKEKTFVGTAYYLPPEIINNKKYSYMADMWSLGVSFYQLMSFKMPFDGDSIPAIINKIIKGKDYAKLNEKYYSKDLINLVYKMMDIKPSHRPKPSDILNMDFIKERIKVYLKENKFDDILSKTIIKSYQDNFNFHNNDNENENENDTNNNDNTNNNINDNNNNDAANANEILSFKNKIKFNNIIGLNKEINTHSKNNKDNIEHKENKEKNINKDKQKMHLGQILLTDIKTKKINSNNDNNNPSSSVNISSHKQKDKEDNNSSKKIQNEISKIKIKIIKPSSNDKNNTSNTLNTKNKNENTIDKNADKNNNNTNINDNNNVKIHNIDNDENEKNNKEKENHQNFDMTIKTDKASYNPDEVKYAFGTKFIESNVISDKDGEKEINLENMNEEFLFDTNKEICDLKNKYDYQRNLNLLNSIILGKSDNEVENENKLINNNESDIEEDEKDNEEDNNDNNNSNNNDNDI